MMSRTEALIMAVTTIHRPLLLLILPPDSNVASSNMASLESGVDYSYLDTGERLNVPKQQNVITDACPSPIGFCSALQWPGRNRYNSLKKPILWRVSQPAES
jgi:hypothetical protein